MSNWLNDLFPAHKAQIGVDHEDTYNNRGTGSAVGAQPGRRKRRCLKCGDAFVSEGNFNRVCCLCAHKNQAMSERAVWMP